jgi:protein required for attachment to host cells
MRKVWILVANGSDAKVYRAESVKHLCLEESFTHPESRLPNHDLVSDGQGRNTERFGSQPHKMEYRHSPKLKEKDHFASEIALYLEKGLLEGKYERLYVIANPTFISLLHHHLNGSVTKVIEKEIHKDLMVFGPEEVIKHLPPVF